MSVSATIQKTMNLGGKIFNQSGTVTADSAIVQEVSVSPGDAGTLSTRTDNDTGVVTVDDSGHAFTISDRVDIYWTGGCRRGMAVTNVSGADVSIDGGAGDNLPTQSTEVTLIEPTLLDIVFSGTNCKAILLHTTKLGQFVFVSSGPTEQYQVELAANKSREWEDANGVDNPITGDSITGVYVSHGDTVAATMKVGVLYNN